MSWITDWVRPGMVAVDVGANAGAVTRVLLDAGADVLAIEPHAAMVETLQRDVPQATILRAAVTDVDGDVDFHYSQAPEHGSLYRANLLEDIARAERVPAVTLDRVCPTADLVKIDAQGAEAAILRGATQLLARRATVWYIELWAEGLTHAGDSVAAVRALFEAHGYVPAGRTWDAVQADADRQRGHSAIDVLIVPSGKG